MTEKTFTVGTKVRLTPDACERNPEIGVLIGTVTRDGGIAWDGREAECWHKPGDLEPC